VLLELLYRWHPWFGRQVAVHAAIEKAALLGLASLQWQTLLMATFGWTRAEMQRCLPAGPIAANCARTPCRSQCHGQKVNEKSPTFRLKVSHFQEK
jgi:hypothetical protein